MNTIPNTTFQFSDSQKNQGLFQIAAGIILIIIAVSAQKRGIAIFASVGGLIIGLGILRVFMFSNRDILKIFDTYLELRPAPVAGLKIIKFSDIGEIEEEKRLILVNVKSSEKPIKIPKAFLNKDEVEPVIAILKKLSNQPAS